MEDEVITIENSWQQPICASDNLIQNRKSISKAAIEFQGKEREVTIVIQAYNQLEKVRRCVESVIKYTQDVDYELLLIDNGSTEPVFEYFKMVECESKKIIRITKNISAGFPAIIEDARDLCPYLVELAGDLVVTERWLSNLLKVVKSDDRIGMVNPVCNNTSNLQDVELSYSDWEEMQEKAAAFNISDPTKWQERMRLITLGTLYSRECLYALGWPKIDVGFMHDFADDDIAFRVRRAGYKTVLAGDTWICHDHPVQSRYNNEKVARSIMYGRENFKEKYYGIDAWDDVNNFIFYLIGGHIKDVSSKRPHILGVDVKCGTPILDIKNQIRKFGKFEADLSAFTQEDKYSVDLHTICGENVICDREEFLTGSFPRQSFDYIVLGRDINRYHEPSKVLLDLWDMLRAGGQLFFSMKNAGSILNLLHMLGFNDIYDAEYCLNYQLDPFLNAMRNTGLNISLINLQYMHGIPENVQAPVKKIIEDNGNGNTEETLNRLMVDKYWFLIQK